MHEEGKENAKGRAETEGKLREGHERWRRAVNSR